MSNEERIEKLAEEKYQEVFGVKKETFERMWEISVPGGHCHSLRRRTKR